MRAHGLFYAIGVIASFLALAAALLALKGAGSAVGWGFQLQNPGVVWVLAVIFFLIGLNLMGAFEVGTFAPSALLNFTAKNPGIDAFFSGVLAVIAASPCTAPFMGAALGFALTQSTLAALAVFAALGVGMALPYVVLAWFPKWLDRLPRPGAWMITFKQALSFPMFLTVVWLIWVIAQQATIDGAAIALIGLVGIAFGAWLLGSLRIRARVAGALAALMAIVLAWPGTAMVEANAAQSSSAAPNSSAQWKPWNPDEIAKLNAEGKPVFVDFTAAWCVSCQANKRLVLTRDEIVATFAKKNVVLMRADWTNRDPRITKALTEMNRSGVPVYALHAPGKPVALLPELLTTGIVKEALSKL
jgi:thiol:disulfide interchange protein